MNAEFDNNQRIVRDTLDYAFATARLLGADDPLHPPTKHDERRWANWVEFVDKVCDPLVAGLESGSMHVAESAPEIQSLLAEIRQVSPYQLAVMLVMARNRAFPVEGPVSE